MANKKKNNAKAKIWALPLSALFGITATVAIAATMVMIGGKLAYGTDDPAQYSRVIGTAALYVSTFLGGLFSKSFRSPFLAMKGSLRDEFRILAIRQECLARNE